MILRLSVIEETKEEEKTMNEKKGKEMKKMMTIIR